MTMSTAPKVALITGVTGQDGSYLAEFLLEKGYVVHGIKRSASLLNTQRVEHIYQDPHIANVRFKPKFLDPRSEFSHVREALAVRSGLRLLSTAESAGSVRTPDADGCWGLW